MPIRPENRDRYPGNWAAISLAVREAAGWRCECDGRCGSPRGHLAADGRCPAVGKDDGATEDRRNRLTASGRPVVLTVAHLDHTPENCERSNLMAMCERCHLTYDAPHHAQTRAAVRAAEHAETHDPLFTLEGLT